MQAKLTRSARATRTLLGWLVVGALAMLAGTVWAQAAEHQPPAADRGKAAGPQQQQQRRAALRAALLAQREADAPKPDRQMRQLTQAERAKLREQLRQQRRDAPPDRNGQSQ
ncbi:MAG: hypothetical protein H7Y28_07005 [Rhodoferax sp.]|nr:hypothetical protein [Rhodoferax sp.]